ncbi:unnamed protein product, partial [Closterium sp. NIES-54]
HRPEHWEAAKRVLRYLCSTSGMELVLGGRGPVVLTGHADASWERADSEEQEGREEQVEQEEQGEQAEKEARVGKEDQEVHGCGGGGCVVSPSPPPPFVPTAATAAGGEGVRVWGSQGSGIGVAGVWSPVPILLLSFPLLQLPLGGGCEGVGEPGEWHWGGGCETNQQPSRHLSSLPPSAAPAAVWGGGGGGG